MTKIILTIVLGLVAATGVGFWYFSGLNTNMQGTTQTEMTASDTTVPAANPDSMKGKDSIMALFKLGKSMECTFSFSSGDMKGEGTGYFDKEKSRVDSLYSVVGDAPMASYMITDGSTNMMYSWFLNEGKMTGMKMSLPKEVDGEEVKDNTKPQAPAGAPQVTPETDVTYDCKPWVVDNSVFVPPRDVEFTDMSEMQKMMEDMQKGLEGMPGTL